MALLDDLLRLVGTNRTRLAWKWRAMKNQAGRRRNAIANRSQVLGYAHQSCPRCGHPAGADEATCSRCGVALLGASVQRVGRVIGWLIPAEMPLVTVALLAACTALFLVTTALGLDLGQRLEDARAGNHLALVRHGAAVSSLIAIGEWWRLITAMFLHVDLLHVVMNGIGLWLAGATVEELFGRSRTFVAFLVTGLAGNLATFAWRLHDGPGSSAGASGAVLGLMGVIIGHAVRYRNGRGRELRQRFVPYALYAVVMGLGLGADNLAHLGGLALGLGIGVVLGDRQAARRWPEWLWRGLALIGLVTVGVALWLAQRDGAAILGRLAS